MRFRVCVCGEMSSWIWIDGLWSGWFWFWTVDSMRKTFFVWLVVAMVWCELFSTGLAVFESLYAGIDYFKCHWYECCDDQWIPNNVTGLRDALNKRLYGQHLVIDTVVRAIRGHVANRNPSKALVMSFHGWTGGGKNYVSNMIAEHLYKKGMKSQYVHLFMAKLHFPHASEVERDKVQLQSWIKGNVSRCGRSLFIFDELDEMNAEILEAIKPFIDYHGEIDGVDYRRSIFIFISNTGGNDISHKALENWKLGKSRESLTLAEMEKVIHIAAYNEQGGLKFSQLISSNLIDHFVPYLPLEREHVKLCIWDHFRWRGVELPSSDQINRVADMLQYFPKENPIYSSSGCKRVPQKVGLLLEEENDEWNLRKSDEL